MKVKKINEEKENNKSYLEDIFYSNSKIFENISIDKDVTSNIAKIYNENTKLRRIFSLKDNQKIALFRTPEFLKIISNIFQTLNIESKIQLPKENFSIPTNIDKAISKRRSVRDFIDKKISAHDLSNILYYSAGINAKIEIEEIKTKEKIEQYLRSYPSGGALYPIEIYILIFNVEGIKPGIYYYNVFDHCLEIINNSKNNFKKEVFKCFVTDISYIKNVSVMFLLTSTFDRSIVKYGPRGYRYSLFECGHIAQNISLTSSALNLGTLMIGGFYDDELNKIIGLNGIDKSVMYAIALGHNKKNNLMEGKYSKK